MLPADKGSYGGFWIRFGAYFVDAAIMLIPSLIISFLIHSIIPTANQGERTVVNLFDDFIGLFVWWAYVAAFLSSPWQATPGKRICGLKVVDENGGRISFGRATGRYFAAFLSILPICIGFLMIAWTDRRQALHDKMAETFVVKAP